ncbi:GntR family transcriptional regulator [Paenarthrobacter sp. NPDC056912]|uniref:GntR family transcriptional regulator n=1 Tax=Paenarthrobacter sp. NPDC056912 TaxID=3345965 RepID=UPI00367166F9
MPSSPVLAERAYQRLREAIVHGELRPNQRLVEAELCELIGIGRTPVRTALHMLEDQSLIVKQRTSWTVREFNVSDIQDVYEARMAMEGFAARLAATRASDEELARIVAILDEHERLEELPPEQQVTLNEAFHTAISAASGNEHLIRLMERNRRFAFDHTAARLYTPEDYRIGHQGHREIAAALMRRDAESTEALVREHYRIALEALATQVGGLARA